VSCHWAPQKRRHAPANATQAVAVAFPNTKNHGTEKVERDDDRPQNTRDGEELLREALDDACLLVERRPVEVEEDGQACATIGDHEVKHEVEGPAPQRWKQGE